MKNKTVYFLIDCSGSMHGRRADAVNNAMEKVVNEALPMVMRQREADTQLYFTVLGFSDAFAEKVVEIMPKTALEDFDRWDYISADYFNGGTPTGAAIQAVIDDIKGGNHGEPDPNAVSPAIILISDGLPNGTDPSYEEVLEYDDKEGPNFERVYHKAIRVALGMNVEDEGRESLKKFGSVSKKMQAKGLEPYYDCSEDYVGDFVEILKSVTTKASE